MSKLLKIALLTSLLLTMTYADATPQKRDRIKSVKGAVGSFARSDKKEISIVDNFKKMFYNAKVSGQVKSMFVGYNQKEKFVADSYATAIGGTLKYELAEYNGFSAGAAFVTSYDIDFLSGDRSRDKHYDGLSSSDAHYTELSEAYINYSYNDLNIRAGRQTLDTPLADSDDIRMIANSFEAYTLSYDLEGFELIVGNIQRWQGFDANLDEKWSKTGEDGTWFGGVSYSDTIEFNAWYYNITKLTNATYVDIGINYDVNEEISLHSAIQYLNEKEISSSGYAADIYGGVVELVAYDIGLNLAYNRSNKKSHKRSFSGTGGGTIFTSMDSMIIDEIAQDRDVDAIVAGIAYDIGDLKMLYAYGDFRGGANSSGEKAHIVEQDVGFEYKVSDDFFLASIYVMQKDREHSQKTQNDWNRLQVMIAYNF